MKLFMYESDRGHRTGVVLNDSGHGIDLIDAEELHAGGEARNYSTLQIIIEGGDSVLLAVKKTLAFALENPEKIELLELDSLIYLPPIPQPVKVLCFSVYEKHMTQSIDSFVKARLGKLGLLINKVFKFIKIPKLFYKRPTYYKGNITSFTGHQTNIEWPSFDENKMDYELELSLIIGKKGRDIKVSDAGDYIWGYSIFNDFSARGRLLEELLKGQAGPLKGKDFHTGNAMGPWIVTADEIATPQNLGMKVYVNGELRGAGNTSEMHYSIPELIRTASEGEYVLPGEVIATGAVGNGTGIEFWRFLEPGDTVRLEIEGIGSLENTLVRQQS